jgi:hypothetical protein
MTIRTFGTSHLTRAAPALAALALVLAVSGCGSKTSGTRPSEPPSSVTGSVTPPHDFAMARQVTVVRSGGIRGDHTTWVFALHRQPPPGFTARDVRAVLKAAANPLLESVGSRPGSSCCDRYVFRLTVLLPDGTSHAYSAVEGNPQPAPLAHLLHLIA